MAKPEPTRGWEAELVHEPRRIGELEADWRELALACGNAFVTPEWVRAWLEEYGGGEGLLVAVARDERGTARGVLPLVADDRGAGRFPGSGFGDCFHPASAEADQDTVARVVGAALATEPEAPRALVLENVPASETWWHELARAGGWARPLAGQPVALPAVELRGRTWEEYLATRSRNLRSQIGRRRRALEREHDFCVRWSDKASVEADIRLLFRLHDLRRHELPGDSSLAGERVRRFHARFARSLAERGWLRLAFLELDGEAVAGWYGWRLGERFAYYQAGFDPRWASRSVGFVLFAETIRAAAAEGARVYDMLLGEEPFKLRFADGQRAVCTAVLAPPLSRARLLGAAEARLRAAGRRLPDPLRRSVRRRAAALLARLPMARHR